MDVSGVSKALVPITKFNQGKASQFFSEAQKGKTFIVMRNNAPVAVVVSLDEYEVLRNLVKACKKMPEDKLDHDFTSSIRSLLSQIDTMDERGEQW